MITGTGLAPSDEEERAKAFEAYDTANLSSADGLDAITRFAASLCDAPIALVSLVEEHRGWFPAATGFAATETPREISFCAHAMLAGEIMVVPDAATDPRFAKNPLVTGEPSIRFYAGAPLVTDEGIPLGSLCVIDHKPRAGLSVLQHEGLTVLAADVMMRLRARRDAKSQGAVNRFNQQQLSDGEQKFKILADTMPQMIWSTLPDGFHDYYNARWYEFTGMPEGSTDGEAWNGMFHPDDQERAWALWRASLATGDPYEIEYRLRNAEGQYRWTLGRALPMRDENGAIVRWFGTCTDIHEQKLALDQREIISHELSHRIKNIFSVISGLIGFSTRAKPYLKEAADELRERVMALSRAHDFVRPHSDASRPEKPQSSLHGMLDELFLPYQSPKGDRIEISGDDPEIDDRSATPIALLFHELATNAAKYGGLSTVDGQVRINVLSEPETVEIRWVETGGPAIDSAPETEGFGARLIEMSAVRQLGGKVTRNWEPAGLNLALSIPASSMSRAAASA